MAWTSAQLTTIETAIIALAGGAEEVQIGEKRFRRSRLAELMALRDQMVGEVQSASDSGVMKIAFTDKTTI
jgi:hypothetical protein